MRWPFKVGLGVIALCIATVFYLGSQGVDVLAEPERSCRILMRQRAQETGIAWKVEQQLVQNCVANPGAFDLR